MTVVRDRESEGEVKRRERVAQERAQGQAGLDPSGVIGKGGPLEPQFGIIL